MSSAGTGKNALSLSLSMRFPDRSPVPDKNRAPIAPEILSSNGAGAWRKAPMAFPDSSSVLDKFQSANKVILGKFVPVSHPLREDSLSKSWPWGQAPQIPTQS